jgi:hypothetical protein
MLHRFLSFLVVSLLDDSKKLTPSDKVTPKLTMGGFFKFNVKIFSWSTLAGGGKARKTYLPGPAALDVIQASV